MEKIITVVAAVIEKDGLIMVARRAMGEHLAGKWEFPGGKIEPNESPEECLQRELQEEFTIKTQAVRFIGESFHRYPDKSIRLLAYEVVWLSGDFILHVHDQIDWVKPEALLKKDLAAADIPTALILCSESQEKLYKSV